MTADSAPPQAGRVAVVTGAGMGVGGIGRTIAAALHAQGARVVVADTDPRVAEVAQRLGDDRALAWTGDLSTQAGARALIAHAIDAFGQVDVLVNNAGGGLIRPFLEHDDASMATTIARNLLTTVWCCHAVLPHMVARNHGRIVNIGADSLRTGIPGHAGYNAAKGGVVGLTVGLAKEFAAHDITVNTVSPCVVQTERFRDGLKTNPDLMRAFVQVVPKGRGAGLSEVADLVVFLARPEAAFITGQDISINGGSAMP